MDRIIIGVIEGLVSGLVHIKKQTKKINFNVVIIS